VSFLLIALGVVLLYFGGDLLVKYASRLALRLGISALVVGLTVVAFGTSAPEIAATLASALAGAPDIAIGNVVGSNIANVGLILGLAAVIYPLRGSPRFMRRELPAMIASGLLLVPVFWSGVVGRLEGAALLALLGAYLFVLFRTDPGSAAEEGAAAAVRTPIWRSALFIALGIALLVVGARALVTGAVDLARAFGISEAVIGLTLVAFGTSLPELASSVAAAARRQGDIILGNVIGSNIFNVLAVLGVTAVIAPIPVNLARVQLDLGVMIGFSVLVLLFMLAGRRLGRVRGALLLLAYAGYLGWLFI
jgi:cation:H+ antiporter